MHSIVTDFAETLSRVDRPAAFCVAGTDQMPAPGLVVEGVGPVALPLLPMQAEQMIAAADRAPFGRGEATMTDLEVRRTWQIGSARARDCWFCCRWKTHIWRIRQRACWRKVCRAI
jgi:hypothetical protein